MRIVVGLGGNLGDVGAAFAAAADALAARHRVLACSRLYRSRAVGPTQPDFLNAALLVATDARPAAVLADCHEIETATGRDRSAEARWGPRRLDLDLLIGDGPAIDTPALVLPHPRLHERRFALLPTAELVPEWIHPRLHRSLADLAAFLDPLAQPCVAIGPFPGLSG
jgi:2-amino-4-hydroxy-6-hydroxymethyldihydropteridine diphosphokinase